MNNPIDRVASLDLTLFDNVSSQTSEGDRRSLLAVQRSVAGKRGQYTYLEIGSHLGGSLQQHVVDLRCARIYSIDPRPLHQPDDRAAGFTWTYENNSSERMLDLLRGVAGGDVTKIQCIEKDASKIDLETIQHRPDLIFIDGEHTRTAVLSDFQFCYKVVAENGVILFHDFSIVDVAIFEICKNLSRERRPYLPLKLEGNVFGIFFDPDLVHSDPYLEGMFRENRHFLTACRFRYWLKGILPSPVVDAIRTARRSLRGK